MRARFCLGAPIEQLSSLAQVRGGLRIHHHFSPVRQVFNVRHARQCLPGQRVDELNVGVADEETAGRAARHRDLYR